MSDDNAVALLNLAIIAMHDGYGEEAVRCFKSALKIKPDLVEAYIGMGLTYSRMDEYVEMAEAFKQAIQINSPAVRKWTKSSVPGNPEWLSCRPEFSHFTGKMAEFLHDLDEADALVRLGATHISRGWDQAAITALEYCLTLAPDYEAAIVLLTLSYLLLDTIEEGAAERLGQNSVLKETAPKLAKSLFKR